jgi:hypothetical protein
LPAARPAGLSARFGDVTTAVFGAVLLALAFWAGRREESLGAGI